MIRPKDPTGPGIEGLAKVFAGEKDGFASVYGGGGY